MTVANNWVEAAEALSIMSPMQWQRSSVKWVLSKTHRRCRFTPFRCRSASSAYQRSATMAHYYRWNITTDAFKFSRIHYTLHCGEYTAKVELWHLLWNPRGNNFPCNPCTSRPIAIPICCEKIMRRAKPNVAYFPGRIRYISDITRWLAQLFCLLICCGL